MFFYSSIFGSFGEEEASRKEEEKKDTHTHTSLTHEKRNHQIWQKDEEGDEEEEREQ